MRATFAAVLAATLTLTGVGVASAATTDAPDPASASISGTVTDAATGAGVSGASVVVLDEAGGQAGSATTGEAGGYTVSGLVAGSYRVSVSAAPDYDPVFWPAAASLGEAQSVDLTAGETRVGVDAALQAAQSVATTTEDRTPTEPAAPTEDVVSSDSASAARVGATAAPGAEEATISPLAVGAPSDVAATGAISGTVTRQSDGAPVADVSVIVTNFSESNRYSTTTAADGTYMVTDVEAGTYHVSFGPRITTGLAAEVWDAKTSLADGTPVSVTSGEVTENIDASLQAPAPTGTVSGIVSTASSGAAIADVSVYVTSDAGSFFGYSTTTNDGRYSVTGVPAGTYRVEFYPLSDSGLASEYWDGAASYSAATLLTVGPGEAVSGIDASLDAAGSISGVVTSQSDGSPVEGVYVNAYGDGGSGGRSAVTGADGAYTVTGLSAADYRVSFYPTSTYVAEYWNAAFTWEDATLIPIAVAQHVDGIDASLTLGGSIAGQVRFDGALWTGADIGFTVTTASGRSVAGGFYSGHSTDGRYEIVGVPEGDYVVEARPSPKDGAASQYYQGAAFRSEATLVHVRSGETTTSIDFDLVAGINIDGTLSAAIAGERAAGEVAAYRWDGSSWQEARRITAWGAYSFAEHYMSGGSSYLPAGTYTVGFEAPGYCTQYWNGVSSLDAATSFTPEVGTTQSGIDAVLSAECDTPAVTPGTPTISGTAKVGETLTAAPGTWGPSPVELAYQWLADGTAIDGATAASLPLTSAQRGKTITVTVTGSRPGYTSASATSAPAGPVTASIAAGTPTITGTAVAGETLTAHPGTWAPSGVALTYQWSAGGAEIAGATGETFVPGTTEVGKTVTVTVVGSRAGYTSASATSAPFGPITAAVLEDLDPGTPTISGTPKLGQPLTVRPGEWGPAPVELTYQWVVDGENVASARGETYTPDAAAVGKNVSVIVRGSKAGYNSATAQAEPVGPVAAGALTPGEPTIGGTPQTGQTLTVDPGTWGPAPVDFAYQWLIDGEPVSGATGTTFVPDASQVGTAVTVTVAGTKPGYATESRTSAPVTIELGALTASTPVIAGVIGVGRELTADVSAWGPAPLDFTYQWLAGEEPIDGATNATFTPDASFVGATIGVTVTGSRPGYASETRTATAGIVPASIVVSEPRVERGQTVTVTGEFYAPNEEVLLELGSDSIELARVTTDAEGRFSAEVTIPATAELAEHEVVGTGQTSGRVGTAPLTVYVPGATPTPTPSASGTPAALPDTLPVSGGTLPIAAIVIGTSLLVAGGLIVRRRRAMS